jgi:hypothetical protein
MLAISGCRKTFEQLQGLDLQSAPFARHCRGVCIRGSHGWMNHGGHEHGNAPSSGRAARHSHLKGKRQEQWSRYTEIGVSRDWGKLSGYRRFLK